MRDAPFTNVHMRKPKIRFLESCEIATARATLAETRDPVDKHCLGRIHYGKKWRWLTSQRPDDTSRHHVVLIGAKPYNNKVSFGAIFDHYTAISSSNLDPPQEKFERLYRLEAECASAHYTGTHDWIDFPLHTLPGTRHRMGLCRAGGSDGLVYVIFKYLPVENLDTIRHALEARLNFLAGHTCLIPDSHQALAHCIAKVLRADSRDLWRPVSLACVLEEWYLS